MHERPTVTRWCSKESNAYIHRHFTTRAHTYTCTHTRTHTQSRKRMQATSAHSRHFSSHFRSRFPLSFSAQARLIIRSFDSRPPIHCLPRRRLFDILDCFVHPPSHPAAM